MDHVVTSTLRLGEAHIGGGARCFVIAEAGVNHNGDPNLAAQLVDAAADAGADAVKFQTFDPYALASSAAPKAAYQERTSGSGTQLDMLKKLNLPRAAYPALRLLAHKRGLLFLSSPFDDSSAQFLAELGVPGFKVPSGELTNIPFLRRLAGFGKPLLLSTGMATLRETEAALSAVSGASVALFHCVSSYPTSPADANLRAMATLRSRFSVPTGWSDHLVGIHVATAAVALGAELLEKHLTLDRNMPGPDHAASTEPTEFKRMISELREVEAALGTGVKAPVPDEVGVAAVARKSLHWQASLPAGTRVTSEHLTCVRPGTGVSPALWDAIVNRTLARNIEAGRLVQSADLVGGIPGVE